MIVKKLIFVLFFVIFVMAVVSSGTLFYAIAFRSRDGEYLLTRPIDVSWVLTDRFAENDYKDLFGF